MAGIERSLRISAVFALVLVGGYGCAGYDVVRDTLASNDPVAHGGPMVPDNVYLLNSDALKSDSVPLPPVCKGAGGNTLDQLVNAPGGTVSKENQDVINNCTKAIMGLIDVRWAEFADELNANVANGSALTDITVMGLNIAGGLTPAGTTKVLGAIAAGLTGSKSIINEDILYKTSVQTILLEMKRDRATWAGVIQARLDPNTKTPYTSMYDSIRDLFAYDRAGSWNEALLSLQANAAAQSSDCEKKVVADMIARSTNTSNAPVATDCNK